MPIDYFCNHCRLTFSTGHFISTRSFRTVACAVCQECGTLHLTQGQLVLEAQPEPMTVPEEYDFDHPNFLDVIGLRFTVHKKWVDMEKETKCVHCGKCNSLVAEWPEDDNICPRCKNHALEVVSSWVS